MVPYGALKIPDAMGNGMDIGLLMYYVDGRRLQNKFECTIDQELSYAAADAHRRFVFTSQAAALFCVK